MKKILALVFIFSVLAVSTLSAKVIGDFNDDGKVSFLDAIALILHINGGEQIAEVGSELGAADPQLERPPLNDEYAYARTDTTFFREAVLIVDQMKEKAWGALLNSDDHKCASFSGEVSGSAVVIMRMPEQYWNDGSVVPEMTVYRVTLDNYSTAGKYYISGEMNYYSDLSLDINTGVPSWYFYSGTMFILGDINADVIINGDYNYYSEDNVLFKKFNTIGYIKSCVPEVLQGRDGWCRGFGTMRDTLLFPYEGEY